MNLIRKSAWSMLLMGLAAGCAAEPESVPPAATAKPSPAGPAVKSTKPASPPAETESKPGAMHKADEPPAVEGPKAENSKPTSKGIQLTSEELAAIKELPAADQSVAISQAVCPVSLHHLGSMDKPVKVTAEGRTFYICCEGCEETVKKDPKAVIAKLDQSKK